MVKLKEASSIVPGHAITIFWFMVSKLLFKGIYLLKQSLLHVILFSRGIWIAYK